MKRKSETNRQNPLERYCSPSVRVTTVDTTQILCYSERQIIRNTTEMEENDDNW